MSRTTASFCRSECSGSARMSRLHSSMAPRSCPTSDARIRPCPGGTATGVRRVGWQPHNARPEPHAYPPAAYSPPAPHSPPAPYTAPTSPQHPAPHRSLQSQTAPQPHTDPSSPHSPPAPLTTGREKWSSARPRSRVPSGSPGDGSGCGAATGWVPWGGLGPPAPHRGHGAGRGVRDQHPPGAGVSPSGRSSCSGALLKGLRWAWRKRASRSSDAIASRLRHRHPQPPAPGPQHPNTPAR